MLQIRPYTYRQKPGFSLSGSYNSRWYKIFVRRRKTAEMIRKAIKAEDQSTLRDLILTEQPQP